MATRPPKSSTPARASAVSAVLDTDQIDITNNANAVRAFLDQIGELFRKGTQLEQAATIRLEEAQALPVPATKEQDEQIQLFARGCATERKAIESHWLITSTVHAIHRRLTARRDKGIKALDEAQRIATARHQAYVDAERRRVAQENAAREAAERAAAEAARRAELEALEADALAREQASPALPAREQRFIDLMVGRNRPADLAASEAGFTGAKAAARLLGMAKIADAVRLAREAQALRQQAAAVEAAPLAVKPHERVEAQIGGAASDRSTWSAEVVDLAVLLDAVFFGIVPRDVLTVDPKKLNEYARALKSNLNRWPGVRAVEKRTIV